MSWSWGRLSRSWALLGAGWGCVLHLSNFGLIIFLGVADLDSVWQRSAAAESSGGVDGSHNLDLDSENALLEEDVSDGHINVIQLGLSSGHEVSPLVLDGLGSLLSDFSRNDHFASLGSGHFCGSKNGLRGGSGGGALEELDFQVFNLSGGAESLLVDWLELQFDVVVLEPESFVHQAQKFVVFPVVLVSQVVEVGNLNNDIHALSGVSDFESGIALKTSKKKREPEKGFWGTEADRALLRNWCSSAWKTPSATNYPSNENGKNARKVLSSFC